MSDAASGDKHKPIPTGFVAYDVNVPLSCRLGLHDKRMVRWDVPGYLLRWRCSRCMKVGTRYV